MADNTSLPPASERKQMSTRSSYLMTMILGGVFFWLPLVIITMVLGKAFQLMKFIAKPLDA